jgi:hypothetical protein
MNEGRAPVPGQTAQVMMLQSNAAAYEIHACSSKKAEHLFRSDLVPD